MFPERSLASAALAVLRERSRLPSSAQYGAWLGRQFAEYFEPYTADPLGSLRQSWTAAVALDWLANSASL